jgi:PAS domain S-box-containing protein
MSKTKPFSTASPNDEITHQDGQLGPTKVTHQLSAAQKGNRQALNIDLNFYNQIHDGVLRLDESGNVKFANPAFLTMLGMTSSDDLLDKPLPENIWRDPSVSVFLLDELKQHGLVREIDLTFYNSDAIAVYTNCSGIAHYDDSGRYSGAMLLLSNITDRRQIQREFTKQHALLEAVMTSTPDPILVLNHRCELIEANPVASKNFKLSETVRLLPIRIMLLHLGVEKDVIDQLEAQFEINIPYIQEITVDETHYHLHCAPLINPIHTPAALQQVGWVCTFHDITSLRSLTDLKTQMIQMTSHDLKNPLNIVSSITSMMLMDADGMDRELLQQMQKACVRMENIINNLLDLERINAGLQTRESLDFVAMIRGLINDYRQQARDKSQKITLNAPFALDDIVISADRAQLQQAIGNLIENAIKYTPDDGMVSVDVVINDEWVQCRIQDSGVGIPTDSIDKIFDPFFRATTAVNSGSKGTGLGLSLAKTIIDKHGGKIRAESIEDKGSTFEIELPIIKSMP